MYAPIVQSARKVREHYLDDRHLAVLLSDLIVEGPIRYAYLLVLFRKGERDPIAIISSELGANAEESTSLLRELGLDEDDDPDPGSDEGKFFLCIFLREGRRNLGDSADWADEAKFEKAGLELARQLALREL